MVAGLKFVAYYISAYNRNRDNSITKADEATRSQMANFVLGLNAEEMQENFKYFILDRQKLDAAPLRLEEAFYAEASNDPNRPALRRMMNEVTIPSFILVPKIENITRNNWNILETFRYIERRPVAFISLRDEDKILGREFDEQLPEIMSRNAHKNYRILMNAARVPRAI